MLAAINFGQYVQKLIDVRALFQSLQIAYWHPTSYLMSIIGGVVPREILLLRPYTYIEHVEMVGIVYQSAWVYYALLPL